MRWHFSSVTGGSPRRSGSVRLIASLTTTLSFFPIMARLSAVSPDTEKLYVPASNIISAERLFLSTSCFVSLSVRVSVTVSVRVSGSTFSGNSIFRVTLHCFAVSPPPFGSCLQLTAKRREIALSKRA